MCRIFMSVSTNSYHIATNFLYNLIINKHFNVKLNYVIATGKDRPANAEPKYYKLDEDRTLHLIQTRLQFSV